MIQSINEIATNIESTIAGLLSKNPLYITTNKSNLVQIDPLTIFYNNPAPNIIEWVTRPEYLNFIIENEDSDNIKTVYDHYGQFQTLRDFFELLCPICSRPDDKDCWDKSRESLESQPLLVWNKTYKDDECPRCKTTRQELIESKLFQNYDMMLLIVGGRAAKSTTAGLIASYIEHKILTYPSPQKLFGQAPRQLFEISFVATTAKQSEKTVFESYKGLRKGSAWIQNYIRVLKSKERWRGELYDESTRIVRYKHINTYFESFTSNSSGIAGGTRIASFIDELARFDSTESKRSAQEIYRVFNLGLKTVRSVRKSKIIPNCFGTLGITTTPISTTDYSMRLGNKAPQLKNMFFIHKPTWKFNPNEPFENFAEDFKLDPVGAERDFGANPPNAERPLILEPERFKQCIIDNALMPTADFIDTYPKDSFGKEYVGKVVKFCRIDGMTEKVIFGDAGKTGDSFALACAHGELINDLWVVVFDWVLTVRPVKYTVSFDSALGVIEKVAEKQIIKMVRFDRWNSESIIQSLRFKNNIDADVFTVGVEHYMSFVQDAYSGRIKMLAPKEDDAGKNPYADMSDEGRAIHELLHLERSLDLKRVDHKSGEHNDLAVCIVGCWYLVKNKLSLGPANSMALMGKKMMHGKIARTRIWQ